MSASLVVPASSVDLAMMLYLNPELVARSNLTSLAAAAAAWDADQASGAPTLASLPRDMPAIPAGFDPRVYLAAQPDVSGLNRTIRDAMLGIGLTPRGVFRRGTYVATLNEDVVLSNVSRCGGSVGFRIVPGDVGSQTFTFTSCNLGAGDSVRLTLQTAGQGTCGDALYGRVASVDGAVAFTVAPDAMASFSPSSVVVGETVYTLSGIRIWDAERQALVTFARSLRANRAEDPIDVVPRSDFRLDTYRAAYPDAKALCFSDAYLDYRSRWRRADEYRIVKGDNIFNLEAPYSSNGGGSHGGTGNAGGYDVTVINDLSVGGHVGIGMACTGYEGCSGEIDAWHSGSSSWPPIMRAGSNTRLAVDGDVFATGTVISLSDARFKREVRPIDEAVSRVLRLTGYTYETASGPGRHTGLLAHEVAAVMPEAVFHRPPGSVPVPKHLPIDDREPDRPVASVAYGNLAGLFVNAIKELASRLDAIESALRAPPREKNWEGVPGRTSS